MDPDKTAAITLDICLKQPSAYIQKVTPFHRLRIANTAPLSPLIVVGVLC